MSEETSWIGGGDGSNRYLVADLGMFHVMICFGPSSGLLESVKQSIESKITCPLRILPYNELIGLKLECSGVPAGFTTTKGESLILPEVTFS